MTLDLTNPELKFALEAVREASFLAQRVQAGMDVKGISKSDLSPVTVADYAGQAVVARLLGIAFPDAVLVGEEDADDLRNEESGETIRTICDFVGKSVPDSTPDIVCDWIDLGKGVPGDRFWTLDPIDGTKGYLRKEQYAVALALIENGKVILGVLGCPNLGADCSLDGGGGVMVAAVRGQGTWAMPLTGEDEFSPLHVSDRADLTQARLLRSVEAGHTNVGQIGELVNGLGIEADPVGLDSQAKYAVLSAGGGELLVRLLSPKQPDYREKIWDQAAGAIVLEEAGGRITDLSGKDLDFSHGRTLAENRGVCASNGVIHDTVIEALAQLSS